MSVRLSVFQGKDQDARIQGLLTGRGMQFFEAARRRLHDLYKRHTGREIENISDGDTAEYLARGEQNTIRHLQAVAEDKGWKRGKA